MRFFINSTSKHPAQKTYENIPAYKRWGGGVVLLITGVVMLPLSLVAFVPNLMSLVQLAKREEIVNVNFVAFFVGGGFFLSFFLIFGSYGSLRHRRAIILEELAEPFRTIIGYSFKTGMIVLIFVSPALCAIAFMLIRLQGYSWCPRLSNASAWDSWWVIDPLLCQ